MLGGVGGYKQNGLCSTSSFTMCKSTMSITGTLRQLAQGNNLIHVTENLCYCPGVSEGFKVNVRCPAVGRVTRGMTQRDRTQIIPANVRTLGMLKLSTRMPVGCIFCASNGSQAIGLFGNHGLQFGHMTLGGLTCRGGALVLTIFTLGRVNQPRIARRRATRLGAVFTQVPGSDVLPSLQLIPT